MVAREDSGRARHVAALLASAAAVFVTSASLRLLAAEPVSERCPDPPVSGQSCIEIDLALCTVSGHAEDDAPIWTAGVYTERCLFSIDDMICRVPTSLERVVILATRQKVKGRRWDIRSSFDPSLCEKVDPRHVSPIPLATAFYDERFLTVTTAGKAAE